MTNDEPKGPVGTREQRMLAVYGAMIAAQTTAQMDRGLGAPDQADMERFIGEAWAVAELSEEAHVEVYGGPPPASSVPCAATLSELEPDQNCCICGRAARFHANWVNPYL